MIIRVCPNDPAHKTFITTAHLAEEWVVNELGDFVERTDEPQEITHWPDHDNIWRCSVCECVETETKETED